jgi:acetyl esterase/lipase
MRGDTVARTTPDASTTDEVGPPPPFDPELAAALAPFAAMFAEPLTVERIATLRQPNPSVPPLSDDDMRRGGTFTVEDRAVPGPEGAPDISLLICRPSAAQEPTAAIYHTHGGGMIAGDNRTRMPEMLDWAEEFGLTVVSVEYRLAPETPHPGPIEDVYAGLVWTAAHADELGIDPDRIVIAGGSGGGALTAALALLARDRGGPAVLGQVLRNPMLDDRNDTASARQMAGLDFWDRNSNGVAWTALLGADRGGPDVSPYAAPARATDLSGLPPTFLDVGSAETLRDEVVTYASRIWAAGGQAELHVWPGGFHGFDGLVPQAAISHDAQDARVRWLRRLLTP